MHQFPEIGKRLKRANGHLEGIIEMLEQGRPCMDIAQQLHAVEKAISNAKKALIKDHIHHCLEEIPERGPKQLQALVEEFEGVTKYL